MAKKSDTIGGDLKQQIVGSALGMTSSTPIAVMDEMDRALEEWEGDWNAFAKDVLRVKLDPDQQAILSSVQHNRRTTVRSGHARGKDFITAVVAVCFLFLKSPCKVICTAPTGRQVNSIMMAEIKGLWKRAALPMGGEILQNKIRFEEDPNWFLEGFKAADKDTEAWTGYHSQNLLVAITEASGIDDDTFNAIEGLLTGDSRFLMVGNPNKNSGEFYHSFKSPMFHKFILDCMNAPNVLARRMIIPGQVDWAWVDDHVRKPGWTIQIAESDYVEEEGDFEWEGLFYRPTDLFRSRVRGMFPKVDSCRLIPLEWVEAAQSRWRIWKSEGGGRLTGTLSLGCDIAGMGADCNCLAHRYGDTVEKLEVFSHSDHMATSGRIKNILVNGGKAYVDTIGEGAGVYSRLKEEGVRASSVKFSESARNRRGVQLHDKTGERCFVNMRAYCYWAMRDALDPQLKGCMMLPPDDEMVQEMAEVGYTIRGTGEIIIEPKDDIKKRLGRSPDRADSIALTFYPKGKAGFVADAAGHNWRG